MTKVLLTGSTGMLGRYVHQMLLDAGFSVEAPKRNVCDLTKPDEVYNCTKKIAADIILHLAAETEVDLCERDPRRAGICNQLSTESIARVAKETNAWMCYVSTANVFGAEGKPFYNELDQPASVNYYGRSKLFGEHAVTKHRADDSLILRAGWMIGGGPELDHKFVGKIIKQIKGGASVLRAVGDRFGTITPASRLAEFIVSSIKPKRKGVFHYASQGMTTRLEIARAIAELMSFKGPVENVMSAEFPLSAPRPYFECIASIYLADQKEAPLPGHWKEDLAKYVSLFK